jgi:hypothetical protein
MQSVSVDRAVRAEPARVLQRVEKWLTANGYEVSTRSAFELGFVGPGTGGRHRLTVRADGQAVRFVFASGSPGVVLPEQGELERRVDSALAEFGPVTAAPAATGEGGGGRCSICATELARGQRVCPTCGMTNSGATPH